MEDFFSEFSENVMNNNSGRIIADFIAEYDKYDSFAFIEGLTDKGFYSIVLPLKINKAASSISFIICGGKKNVISSMNYLMNNNLFIKKNHYHIVDKDYNGIKNIKCYYPEKLTITRYYSFENYAFEDCNYDVLLSSVNLPKNDYSMLKNNLNDYIDQIMNYETLSSLNTNYLINVQLDSKHFSSRLKVDENNIFKLDKDYLFYINYLIDRLDDKEKALFKSRKNKLLKDRLSIRGHDLEMYFNTLMEYYQKDITLNDLLSDENVVKKLKIQLNLK